MNKEGLNRAFEKVFEAVTFPLFMALTQKQREWVRDVRDNGEPQLPIYLDNDDVVLGYCTTPKKCPHLEVNHITSQREGGGDEPRNLITIPKCVHVGVCPSENIKDDLSLERGRHAW